MIVGFFLVQPIPLHQQEGYHIIEGDTSEEDAISTALLHNHNISNTHLLDNDFIEARHPHYVHHHSLGDITSHDREAHIPTQPEEIPLTVVQDPDDLDSSDGDDRSTGPRQPLSQHREPIAQLVNLPNLYGKKLFTSIDFWLLCSILSIRKLTRFASSTPTLMIPT